MSFRLKKESYEFQVIREGKFEYKHFKHGEVYEEIPDEEKERFETIESSMQKAESSDL
jgi:hypothetical protein